MHPDRLTIPEDGDEIDTSTVDEEGINLPPGVATIEIVNGPTEAPYGTLVVEMAKRPGVPITLTRLEIGYEHSGQFRRILEGTTVTRVRWWA